MDIDEKDAMLIGHLGRDETKNDEDGYEIPVFGTEAVPNRDRQAVWTMADPWRERIIVRFRVVLPLTRSRINREIR